MEGARITAQKAHELDPFNDTVNRVFNGINDEFSREQAD
jgi:hypothetical protein